MADTFDLFLVCICFVCARSSTDVRLVDGAGTVSSVGLLQVQTDAGFGTVCGANPAAADVVCRSMGYAHGSVSDSPCGFYGGADLCGAAGSPVAMANLQCSGSEWSLGECFWSAPDGACMGHREDTIVYCAKAEASNSAPQGSVRLLSHDGSPAIDGKGRPEVRMGDAWVPICSSGTSSGSAAVICKSMGFSGADGAGVSSCVAFHNNNYCGDVAPGLSDLACSGSESEVLACPHEAGEDVFCAPTESVSVACIGDGETQGRPAKEAMPKPLLGGLAALAPTHRISAVVAN